MSLREKRLEFLAGQFDLPVFICMWVWAVARFITSGGQPDALLAPHGNHLHTSTDFLHDMCNMNIITNDLEVFI